MGIFSDKFLLLTENEDLKIKDIRSKLLHRMLLMIVLMAIPTLILAAISEFQANLIVTGILYTVLPIPIFGTYIFRKRISPSIIVFFLYSTGLVIGTLSIFYYGLIGSAIPVFLLVTVLVTTFEGIRKGLYALWLSGIPLIFLGILYSTNKIQPQVDIISMQRYTFAWITVLAVLYFLGSTIIYTYGVIQENLIHSSNINRQQAVNLSIANRNLEKDIAKRIKIQEELEYAKAKAEKTDNLKTAFLRNISHEFRTPINGIVGYSSLLGMPGIDTEKRSEYIKHIQNSCNQLLNIVNDTIEIAQVQTNTVSTNFTEVNVSEILNEHFTLNMSRASQKNIKFLIKTNASEIKIVTDKAKIHRILFHLIDNALKFTNNGEIVIEAYQNHHEIQISVNDTGIGIPPEKLKEISQPFIQGDNALNRHFEGMGVGLSLIYAYSKVINGSVNINSTIGEGTNVTITIPNNPPS